MEGNDTPLVTKEAVLSVLKDPDFKNELNKMISTLIRTEFAKMFDDLKAELAPYVYKAGINLKKIIEREFPGGELTTWKYLDQKGSFLFLLNKRKIANIVKLSLVFIHILHTYIHTYTHTHTLNTLNTLNIKYTFSFFSLLNKIFLLMR
jgi:hypothetical protein